jgi:hypothetical protein
MKRSYLLPSLLSFLCAFLSACGSGSSAPPPVISVTLSPNSTQTLDANQSASLTAMVTNDSSNRGVTWTLTCPTGITLCGTMAHPSSGSGIANQYVA